MDTVEAVFERGVFKPLEPVELPEGQSVTLSFVPHKLTREEAEAEVAEMGKVYEGLTDEEIAEVEPIALDR